MGPVTLARLARAFASGWVARPLTPTRMVLSITRRCNLRCGTCRSPRLEPGDELSPAEVASLCRAAPGLAWLDVTGGEPFIRRDVLDVFDAILQETPALAVLHFPTNGTHPERAEAVARRIRAARPAVELLVTVSFDGPREVHDRVRGPSFSRAIETWRRLRAVPGVRLYAGTTASVLNEADLSRVPAALARELPGFDERSWHMNLFQVADVLLANADLQDLSPRDPFGLVAGRLAHRGLPRGAVDLMESLFLANLLVVLSGRPPPFSCQALRTACFVSADGRVYPCHVWDRPVGSLRSAAFRLDRIWASDAARDARAAVERRECGGCFTPCEAYPAIAGAPVRAAAGALLGVGLLAARHVPGWKSHAG